MDPAVLRQSSGASLYHPARHRLRFGPPLFPRENRPVMPPLRLKNRQLPKAAIERVSISSSSVPLILECVRKLRPSTYEMCGSKKARSTT